MLYLTAAAANAGCCLRATRLPLGVLLLGFLAILGVGVPAISAAEGGSLTGTTHGSASGATETSDLARSIAATIIHERSLSYASAGQQILALQLDSLAKGLRDGKVTLADAALVMQVVGSAAAPEASSVLTAQAKSSVQRAESLLDGASAPVASAPTLDPLTTPATVDTHATTAEATTPVAASAPPKVLITDVCGVQDGDDHHVMVAALSANSKDGLIKGEHVVFKLKGKLVAQGTVLRLDDNLSFVEVTKGSQVDPNQDVTEQCQAIVTPNQ